MCTVSKSAVLQHPHLTHVELELLPSYLTLFQPKWQVQTWLSRELFLLEPSRVMKWSTINGGTARHSAEALDWLDFPFCCSGPGAS